MIFPLKENFKLSKYQRIDRHGGEWESLHGRLIRSKLPKICAVFLRCDAQNVDGPDEEEEEELGSKWRTDGHSWQALSNRQTKLQA